MLIPEQSSYSRGSSCMVGKHASGFLLEFSHNNWGIVWLLKIFGCCNNWILWFRELMCDIPTLTVYSNRSVTSSYFISSYSLHSRCVSILFDGVPVQSCEEWLDFISACLSIYVHGATGLMLGGYFCVTLYWVFLLKSVKSSKNNSYFAWRHINLHRYI